MSRMPRLALCLAAAAAVSAALAAPALAVPGCPGYTQAPKTLISGRGTLESVIVDPHGRLYFTDVTAGELLRVNHPGGKAIPVVENITAPGGLAFDDGKLIVGFGDAIATASAINPVAGLIIYNPKTGDSHTLITGTQMSNGIARGPDGAIYASSDVGLGIDRVFDGAVEINWAPIASPNGLSVSRNGKWLYSNQTFVPAQISRIEIAESDQRAALRDARSRGLRRRPRRHVPRPGRQPLRRRQRRRLGRPRRSRSRRSANTRAGWGT